MICPNCKHEKMDQDVCSQCGMGEKQALLSAANLYRRQVKTAWALDCYDKFLKLEQDNFEILRERAVCLCFETVSKRDAGRFQRANQAIQEALERDWAWERGHQYRVELYSAFGKLPELEKDYAQIAQQDEARKKVCENVLRVIQLTQKFREEPPTVTTTIPAETDRASLIKSFWPLLSGLPLVFWSAFKVPVMLYAKDQKSLMTIFFFLALLIGVILVLFLVSLRIHRKNREEQKGIKAAKREKLVYPNFSDSSEV